MIGVGTTIFLVNPTTFPIATSYLLDTYTAAAAYSLRQLKTGVTNVVRVRRTSDNAEQDFTATEVTDGTLATFCSGTNGAVVTMYDQSGNGYDITQATGTSQAVIVSGGVVDLENAKPCLSPDGGDSLQNASFDGSTVNSWFVVANITNTNARIWTTDNASDGLRNTSGNNITARGTSDITIVGSGTTQGQTIYTAVGGTSISTFYNGNTGGTGTISAYINGTLTAMSGTGGMTGTFQELILFTTDQTSNRTTIESDINTHYSIY